MRSIEVEIKTRPPLEDVLRDLAAVEEAAGRIAELLGPIYHPQEAELRDAATCLVDALDAMAELGREASLSLNVRSHRDRLREILAR